MRSPQFRSRIVAVGAGLTAAGLLLASCGVQGPSQTPTPRTSRSPAPSASVEACSNQSVLAGWPIDRLTEQVVVIPVQETDVGAVAADVSRGVGGLLLFGNSAPADLGTQLGSLEDGAPGGILPLVMTDEEGGGVQRMANLVGSLPWARQMGSSMTPAQIENLAESTGLAMLQQGVTMDLAPVLDIDGGDGPNAANADGWRSFSPDRAVATTDGLAFAAGLAAAGVIPVVKHFPGLGGASANTDDGPATTLPYSTLVGAGLAPFEAALNVGLPAVMVSNASVPGLTTLPASLSAAVIEGLLVRKLHFPGLILTDSLSALSIADLGLTVAQATVQSIAAGVDMITFSAGDPLQVTASIEAAMVAAIGGVQGAAGRRRQPCPQRQRGRPLPYRQLFFAAGGEPHPAMVRKLVPNLLTDPGEIF